MISSNVSGMPFYINLSIYIFFKISFMNYFLSRDFDALNESFNH